MIFHHIHHKMPIYKDCTFLELMSVGSLYLIVGGALFAFLTQLLFDYAAIGMALILLSLIHATRFFLGKLQQIKYGKPYGYYQHVFLKRVSAWPYVDYFWQAPWLQRQGRWSVNRLS